MKKKIFSLIFCVFCAVIVYAQNGLWTDEGNYSAEWFGSQYPSKEFHIKNAEELAALASVINNGYTFEDQKVVLDADIDLSQHYWMPTGMSAGNVSLARFSGIFEGNGHIIKGLKIHIASKNIADRIIYVGLFGLVGHGIIQNLTIDATSRITIISDKYLSEKGIRVGSFSGSCLDGSYINCVNEAEITIEKIAEYATAESISYIAGGIVGDGSGKIENCINKGNIKVEIYDNNYADNLPVVCGGIAGTIDDTEIISCTNFGNITAISPSSGAYAGGIFGDDRGTITDCINWGDITASGDFVTVGGICSYGEGNFNNCTNSGRISATSVYEMNVGGIVGTYYWSTDGLSYVSMCRNCGEIICKPTFMMGVSIGGIAGFSGNRILNCWNLGNIVVNDSEDENRSDWATADIGGIAGAMENTVMNCYNRGSVSAETGLLECDVTINAGGIAGNVYSGSVGNSYNTGNVTAKSPFQSYSGGITGGTSNCFLSYYAEDIQISGKNLNEKGTPLTSEQMKGNDYNLAEILNDYAKVLTDANLWEYRADENDGYPVLTNKPASVLKMTTIYERIYGSNGKLVIVSSKPGRCAVYDIQGKLVCLLSVAGGENHFDLPPGIYIIGAQRVKL